MSACLLPDPLWDWLVSISAVHPLFALCPSPSVSHVLPSRSTSQLSKVSCCQGKAKSPLRPEYCPWARLELCEQWKTKIFSLCCPSISLKHYRISKNHAKERKKREREREHRNAGRLSVRCMCIQDNAASRTRETQRETKQSKNKTKQLILILPITLMQI